MNQPVSDVLFRGLRTVKVNVVQAELAQSLVELLLDILRGVIVVPKFRSNEELFTLHNGRNHPLQCGTNFVLILVDQSTVNMPVAGTDGNFDLCEIV